MKKIEDYLGIGEKIVHQEPGYLSIDPTMPKEKKGTFVMTNRRITFFVEKERINKILDVTRMSVEGFRIKFDERRRPVLQLKTPSIIATLRDINFKRVEDELKSDLIAGGKIFTPSMRALMDFTVEHEGFHPIMLDDDLLGYVDIPPYFSTLFQDATFYNPERKRIGGIRHLLRVSKSQFVDADERPFGFMEYLSPMSMRVNRSNGRPVCLVTMTQRDDDYELIFLHPHEHVPLGSAIMRRPRMKGTIQSIDIKFFDFPDDPKFLIFSTVAIKRLMDERGEEVAGRRGF